MGGNQSSQKGNIDDIFKHFEEELARISTTSKNLKETWQKNGRTWVPGVLFSEMEETEKKWKNIKSMILPPEEKVNEVEEEPLSGKMSRDFQDIIQEKDQRIKQLEKNNDTLLQKGQAMESELTYLRKTVNRNKQGSLIDSKLSKPADKQPTASDSISSSNSSISETKERKSTGEEIVNSPRKVFLMKMLDFESKCKEEKAVLMNKNEELSVEIKSLNARIKDLEKEKLELNARLAEHMQRPGSGTRGTETQENEKKKEKNDFAPENESDANNGTNEKQMKQKNGTEEYSNLIKKKIELQDAIDKLLVDKHDLVQAHENEGHKQQYGENHERSVPVKHEKPSGKDSNEEKLKNQCHENIALREEINMLKAQNDSMETYANQMKLSKFAGDNLVENNPAVTDLSDPNRPTKLAEYYSELYDNEWTNAFEALEFAGYDDRTAIETLRLTLENVFQFCEGKAELLLKKASDAVNLLFKEYQQSILQKTVPSHLTIPRQNVNAVGKYLLRENSSLDELKLQRLWKPKSEKDGTKLSPRKVQKLDTIKLEAENKLKTLRKEMASTMVPVVQKAYIEASWTDVCIDEMKPYILKCLYLGWMMKVQTPPMAFHKCETEVGFNRNLYKEYVTSGPRVNYVVWPALLLHEDGPLVC